MVRKLAYLVICIVVCSLIVLTGCKKKVNIPPELDVTLLPDIIEICKNGYRTFDLDSIVNDLDDADSLIWWTITAGPLISIIRHANSIDLKPIINQTGKDWVNFLAVDPAGDFAAKTCTVFVDTAYFRIRIRNSDTIKMNVNTTVELLNDSFISYNLNTPSNLTVSPQSADTTSLKVSWQAKKLKMISGSVPDTTYVYFEVYDPKNHVTYNRSLPAIIKLSK